MSYYTECPEKAGIFRYVVDELGHKYFFATSLVLLLLFLLLVLFLCIRLFLRL